ncbi:hypothetical protein A961_970 [Enterococcus faecalis ATCC 29212]|nr:hypothetical protein A961_970 [Enterococcus faecalis ATCC 29212]KAJ67346.1 hypothetical protein P787_0614 [Enterococcus faecalis MN16]
MEKQKGDNSCEFSQELSDYQKAINKGLKALLSYKILFIRYYPYQ